MLIYGIRRGPYLLDLGSTGGAEWLGQRLAERRPDILFGDSDEYRRLERDGVEALEDAMLERRREYAMPPPRDQEEWRKDAVDDFMNCVHAWEV